MSDDLQQLLRTRQAKQNASLNEAALQEQLTTDQMPRPMVSRGFDADSGTTLVQPLGGDVLAARPVTNGAIALDSTVVGRQSGQLLRVDQMPSQRGSEEQFREQTITTVPVLFSVDAGDNVEYWLGGDRQIPVKITTIPKYGPEFELSGSFSSTVSYNESRSTLASAAEGTFYQGLQAFSRAGSISVSSNIGYPEFHPFLPRGDLLGTIGFSQNFRLIRLNFPLEGSGLFPSFSTGSGVTKGNSPGSFANPPIVNFSPGDFFPDSNSESVNEVRSDIYTVGIDYDKPQQLYYEAAVSSSGVASDGDRFYGIYADGTGSGSLRATAREIYSRRVYMSASGRNVYITIAYDLKSEGYTNLLMFAVSGNRVVELPQPARQDWRRSLAVPDYKPPSTGDVCVDQLRENGKVNLLQRTRLEADFTEVEGDMRTTDLMVPILRQTVTPSGDRCQVTPIPPQVIPPVKLYSLQNSAAVPLYICPTQYQRRVER